MINDTLDFEAEENEQLLAQIWTAEGNENENVYFDAWNFGKAIGNYTATNKL